VCRGIDLTFHEQDVGAPGLWKAKESYHPVKMVEKYAVRGK